jgi:hypothetical protein
MVLYHSAMAHLIPEINDICAKDDYYRFADRIVRQVCGFWQMLSLNGAEVAAATMCGTDSCPTCKCPKANLDSTEDTYAVRSTESVRKQVDEARARHLKEPSRTAI